MGDCLSRYFIRYRGNGSPERSNTKTEAGSLQGKSPDLQTPMSAKVEVVTSEQVESRERAMALVLASLSTKDEALHEYIFEWIVTAGRSKPRETRRFEPNITNRSTSVICVLQSR